MEEREYLPYGASFRVRLLLCGLLFLCFVFAENRLLTPERTEKIYTVMEQNVPPEEWMQYTKDMFGWLEEGKRGENEK